MRFIPFFFLLLTTISCNAESFIKIGEKKILLSKPILNSFKIKGLWEIIYIDHSYELEHSYENVILEDKSDTLFKERDHLTKYMIGNKLLINDTIYFPYIYGIGNIIINPSFYQTEKHIDINDISYIEKFRDCNVILIKNRNLTGVKILVLNNDYICLIKDNDYIYMKRSIHNNTNVFYYNNVDNNFNLIEFWRRIEFDIFITKNELKSQKYLYVKLHLQNSNVNLNYFFIENINPYYNYKKSIIYTLPNNVSNRIIEIKIPTQSLKGNIVRFNICTNDWCSKSELRWKLL